jgi:hypothetical protein
MGHAVTSRALAALVASILVISGCGEEDGPALRQPSPPGTVSPRAGQTLPEYSRSYAATVEDLDGEGHDDILLVRHNSARLAPEDVDGIWRWTPDGYELWFQFPLFVDRHGCAAADIDGDGDVDIHCILGALRGGRDGDTPKANETWLQEEGTFVAAGDTWGAPDPYGRARMVTFADFDGDGRPDLYVTNAGDRIDGQRSENILYRNTGSAFAEVPGDLTGLLGVDCLVTADWNADGLRDVIVCDDRVPRLMQNRGEFRFEDVTATIVGGRKTGWRQVVVADLDGAGPVDLAVMRGSVVEIHLGRPGEELWPEIDFKVEVGEVAKDLAAGDFTGSGDPDLYVVRQQRGCPDLDVGAFNASDVVAVGPDWSLIEVPGHGIGCGHLVRAVDGRYALVLNGDARTQGPVDLLDLSGLDDGP